jgi:predicted lipoprotein with Yx(FWY)xxD motif
MTLTIQHANDLAASKDGTCLSIEWHGNHSKYTWQCDKEHVWGATYNNILHGSWCPFCAGVIKRSEKDFDLIAANNGGLCLFAGKNALDAKSTWQCKEGHQWKTCYNSIQQGRWCPFCAHKAPKTKSDYNLLASTKDGKCLFVGTTVLDNKSKWQCKDGHIWRATYNSINSGAWCPECSLYKTQKFITQIIRKLFGKKIEIEKKFDWLINTKTGRPLKVDIWVPDIKLAIEYDGEQHFKPVRFGGISIEKATQMFKETKQRDRCKNKAIKNHKNDVVFFIRFNYKEIHKLNKEYIIDRLKYIGVSI